MVESYQLPLHEQVKLEGFRRTIEECGPQDFEGLKQAALNLLGYAKANRGMCMLMQQQLLQKMKQDREAAMSPSK